MDFWYWHNFPIGLILSKILHVNLFTKDNPLATLAGLSAAPQAFYIPVFILVYINSPQFIPFTVGLLAGSHFLPYMWIYKSKTYLFVTLGTSLTSLLIGSVLLDQAFTLVPLGISFVYILGAAFIIKELKVNHS